MTSDSTWAERALQHARQLAARIGPRGATSPAEKQAADYAQRQMQQLGLRDVRVETFSTATGGWLPITIIFSIAVWSVFACWSLFYITRAIATQANATDSGASLHVGLPGALLAIGLCLIAVIFLFREITLRDHALRRFGLHAHSQNVIGMIAPAQKAKRRIVLISHLDTPPASAVLKTPRRVRLFRAVFYLGGVSLVGSIAFFLMGGLDVWVWAFVVAGICGMLQSAVIVQALRADHGPFTPGANHNASGVGTVLALAERLRSTPLPNTEVWAVCCGSHTAGGSGLRDLLCQHAAELDGAWFIGFEGVGIGDRLIAIEREGWLRRSVHPAVRDLLARAAAAQPDRSIETRTTWRNTITATALWRGDKSVCLSVYDRRNEIPYAYNLADKIEQLQLPALNAAQEFGWQLLQQIDRGE